MNNLKTYIKPIKIGNLKLDNNVFLAPLAGVTDLAFRLECKRQGAGLVYSEMISAKGVHYGGNASLALADTEEEEQPLCVQLFGSEPDLIAEAAVIFEKRGAKMIDINMGCPMRKVTGNGEGSALLKKPALIREIVARVSSSVEIPVTVKMRRGYETGCESALACSIAAEEGGADAVCIHGRYRDEYYTGVANLEIIRKVKESLHIPIIGNGDITSIDTAVRMFEETACDAIMIGRGALGNPWIFRELLTAGTKPTLDELQNTMTAQLEKACLLKGEMIGVSEMRKHIAWYLKGLKGAARVKDAVCRATQKQQVRDILTDYFQTLREQER